MTSPSDREHLDAGTFLAAQGLYGFVWIDRDLVARKRLGELAGFVPLGEVVTEGVAALMGFDEQIRALPRGANAAVLIPNVQLEAADLDAPRCNLSVHWLAASGQYLLLVARVLSRTGVEELLEAQVRLRRIAEEEVAQQKRLLERSNDELERANADLGAFASVISHDLRSPLRALRHVAEDAQSAIARGDRAAATAHVARVADLSRRMSRMLGGLLEYSRIGRKAEIAEATDTGALAREIAAAIERPPGLAIAVEGEWPVLVTLAEPLDIVLRNLVDNAVKHHDRSEGRIVVTAEDAGRHLVIAVEDDGPGIPSEWHEAVFAPFRRIGDSDDPATPEGAGLGLALVRKTVEVVGGTISVESDPERRRGTTFRVAWPKRIEA